jgi:HlyD family secretion protein
MFLEEDQKKALDKELAAAKDNCDAMRKLVDTATLQQKIFRRYDYPQNLNTRRQAVENARLEVDKARVAATGEVRQKEEELAKHKDALTRLEREIKDLNTDIARCVLTAPVDGLALYGDPSQGHIYYGGDQRLRVGMEWYGGNTIMTIPDLSAFEVTLTIGEENRGKVAEGCKAIVTIEAIPGLTLQGTLNKIGKHAQPRTSWDQSAPKVFEAVLALEKCDPRMVSGMTARVEILAETVPNALVVPIEAVFNEDGKPVCYVRRGDRSDKRPVKCGKSNDHLVEIVEGLGDGEEVDASPTRAAGKP